MNFSPSDLRQVSVFAEATDDDLNAIAQNSFVRSIEEGEFFFFQGDPAEYLYVLTSGQVKLMQSNPNGKQVNIRTVQPWEMFAALGAVRKDASYPVSAQALQDSTALVLRSDFMNEMMQTRPYLAIALTRLMTEMLFEVKPTDPTVFAGVAAVLMVVALVASLFPSLRVIRIKPAAALRYE